jgi:cytochrome c553
VGLGNPGSGFPALRAQHSTYTLKQLLDYTSDQRYLDLATGTPTKSRNGHMMASIAKRLTEEDKKALASYIQGLR